MKKVGVGVLWVFVLCFFVSVPLHAQVTGATLSGTVTDASGAVIANAQVSIRNTATGISKDTTTDSAGFYAAPNLAPGPYEVKVTAAGFNTLVTNVTLAVGAQQTLNVPMKVGETSQTVQVTEAAPQIELTSSTLMGQVESQTVLELPLNGRDWTSLATLHPGVNLIQTQMDYATSARGNRGFGAELTISGQRTTNNNYRLDGISVNDYANSGPGNVIGAALGVDAIQEFSVLTGSFSAEYGKASGGVVNAITKSGTNSFHGDVYEFIRNSALDSRDYFARTNNSPNPTFRRNQFGAAAGGPIIKDKTFFFGDYEGMRQAKGITTTIKVPSPNARLGILAGKSPLGLSKGTTCTTASGSAGKILDDAATNCVDNSADMVLNQFPMWPLSTNIDPSSADRAIYTFSGVQIVPENFYTARIDHKLGTNDSLFGTYLFDNTIFSQPDSFNNDILSSRTRRQTVVLSESHTFGPSVVNAARVGYSRSHALNLAPAGAVNPNALLTTIGSTTGQTMSTVDIKSGNTRNQGGNGSASNYEHTFNNYQIADDAFWTRGAHTLKFGVDVEREQYNYIARQNPGGRWNFTGMASFLNNLPAHFEAGIPSTITPRELRQTLIGGYVQDDWRFRSNLTINLGLRYEMVTVINDAQGKLTNLANISDPTPQCGTQFTSPFAPGGISPPGASCGSVGPYYSNPTTRNFEPRIGFAWDPFRNGKTSVRGGFGIYDVLPLPGYFLLQENQAAPFMIFASQDQPACSKLPVPPPGCTNVMAGQFFAGGQNLLTNTLPASKLSTSTIETNPHRNYVLQWNLNVQRQVTPDLSVTAGYIGSHGVHMLIRGDDGNMTAHMATTEGGGLFFPGGPRVNTALGTVRYVYWGTDSFYHALNINVDKRMSHGLQFQVAYTWAKSIDDNSSTIAGDTFGNGLNSLFYFAPKSLRGVSDYNVGQNASINVLWALPSPKSGNGLVKAAVGGWQVGTIFKINTGVPTTAIIDGDPMGVGNSGADGFGIPNITPGCDPINHGYIGSKTPVYIKTGAKGCYSLPTVAATSPLAPQCLNFDAAEAPPPTGQVYCANLMGNAGRNTIVGPRLINFDFSATKNNPIHRISETFNIQFRAEMFNIFNHSNFNPPLPYAGGLVFNEDGSDSEAGDIRNLSTSARDIQFAIKVIW
jgi:outer membrane receptor protein involved in Fe transport